MTNPTITDADKQAFCDLFGVTPKLNRQFDRPRLERLARHREEATAEAEERIETLEMLLEAAQGGNRLLGDEIARLRAEREVLREIAIAFGSPEESLTDEALTEAGEA